MPANTIRRVNLFALLVLSLSLPPASADIAERAQLLRITVAGLTLQSSAREAFETLKAQGFDTGHLATYDDWWQSGLVATKGHRNDPDGQFEIALSRNGDQLVEIREHRIRMQTAFDVAGEIEERRRELGLAADSNDCLVASHGKNGSCGAQDADETVMYLLNFNGNRQRYAVVKRLDVKPAELTPPMAR